MKSRPLGTGQSIFATQANDKRDDARASSFLLAHQQLGALALGTAPTNGQTVSFVINGTTVTAKAVASVSAANDIYNPDTPLGFATNLLNWLRRPDLTNSNQVAASAANQALLSYVGWAWPGSSTTIVPFSLNKNVNGITGALTSFNITTTVTSGSWTAQTMQLYVEDGTYYINGTRYFFTGGSTPTVTAPSSHPRIDVLTIDTSGTLAWTTGTENASPSAPTYPANKLAICELYNVVSETALYDNENQQSGEGYISNDVRPAMSYGPVFSAIAEDMIPDAADTRNLGSSGSEWNNIYGKALYIGGLPFSGSKFGGTGADGALSISSGTTTLNMGGASVYIKNYSSISITGTGALAFSNPASTGTIIIIKCQGSCTITSSATAAILADGMGAAGGAGGGTSAHAGTQPLIWAFTAAPGAGGTGGTSGNYGGPGGGGASVISAASGGSANNGASVGSNGNITGIYYNVNRVAFMKAYVEPGAGGGSGTYNYGGTVGAGGNGGGAVYIEVAGALNFGTGAVISANGSAGGSPSGSYCGAGGGGGGGVVAILYNTLTANNGTIAVNGGAGGTGGGTGGTGGAGTSYIGLNTEF